MERAYIQVKNVIKFSRGLGKTPYPTLIQFISLLTSFDIRKEEDKMSQQNYNIVLSAQKGKGRNNNINFRITGFKLVGQE